MARADREAKDSTALELDGNGAALDSEHEEQPASCLPDVTTDGFNSFIGAVIVMNAIVMGFETDYGSDAWYFQVFQWFFLIVFCSELLMRILQLKWQWPKDPWNLFDGFLVVIMFTDMVVMPYIGGIGQGGGMFASLLRLLRLSRVLRIIRLFRMFSSLSMILSAFGKAFNVVLWVGFLAVVIDYILAILLVQMIGHQAEDWGDGEDAETIRLRFGSIPKTMFTLFSWMTCEAWDATVDVILLRIPGYIVWPCCMAYIMVVSFAIVALITGEVCSALGAAREEEESLKLAELEQNRQELQSSLIKLFAAFEVDGMITEESIRSASHDKEFFHKLEALDFLITEEELVAVYRKMSLGKPISVEAFAEDLGHLTGTAKESSLFELRAEIMEERDLAKERHDSILVTLDMIHKRLRERTRR